MKKILVFLMFLLSLTTMAERFVVISKDKYANLREEASTNSKVLAKVDNSYLIYNTNTYNENKDWYSVQIERDGNYYQVGYIHKSQLGIHPETYITSSKDGYINVRAKASTSSKVLAELPNDAYVTRYPKKTVGDWYYVDYDDDGPEVALAQGYIHKSQLKKYKK
jgi:glutaminase